VIRYARAWFLTCFGGPRERKARHERPDAGFR
jgi:hypothetical protein